MKIYITGYDQNRREISLRRFYNRCTEIFNFKLRIKEIAVWVLVFAAAALFILRIGQAGKPAGSPVIVDSSMYKNGGADDIGSEDSTDATAGELIFFRRSQGRDGRPLKRGFIILCEYKRRLSSAGYRYQA